MIYVDAIGVIKTNAVFLQHIQKPYEGMVVA